MNNKRSNFKNITDLAQQPQAANNIEPAPAPEQPIFGRSVKVYGGKAALTFQAGMTRGEIQTVTIESARSTAPRQYDWSKKLSIMLTRKEMPRVAAVMLGFISECSFSNHGTNNDKGFEIKQQKGGVFIRLFSGKTGAMAIPVDQEDLYYVTGLFIEQLKREQPWFTGTEIISLLKVSVGKSN